MIDPVCIKTVLPPRYVFDDASLRDSVERIAHEHAHATEALTERQLASALLQAIEAGDFLRNVCVEPYVEYDNEQLQLSHTQAIVYLPGHGMDTLRAERDSLASRVALLESILEEARIDVPCEEDAR